MSTQDIFLVKLADWFDLDAWPLSALVPDTIDELFMAPPETDPYTGDFTVGILFPAELALRIPGIDAFSLVVSPAAGGTLVTITTRRSPFGASVTLPLVLRIDTRVLCPVDAEDRPDPSAKFFDVNLGDIDLTINEDGHLAFDLGATSLKRCMIGRSGVIVEVGKLQWVSPATDPAQLPGNTHAGFTGIFLDDVEVKISQLPAGVNQLRLDDAFIGTGGFSGKISALDLNLNWDKGKKDFTGFVKGDIFGFKGGLSSVSIEFRQSALVGCAIAGDVLIPWLDTPVGLEFGLTGAGDISALVCKPHSQSATGVSAGQGGHLISINAFDVLTVNVDALHFSAPHTGPATVEIAGSVKLAVENLDLPEVGVTALRIDAAGRLQIDGGQLSLPTGTAAPFHGFPLEVSKIGFGSEGADDKRRMWVSLSGGIKLAAGLPIGGSVDGLKVSWRTSGTPDVKFSLSGVAIKLDIPNVVRFSGSVAFIDDDVNKGFRGDGQLSLPSVGIGIDVGIVIGRNTQTGDTFFYFYLGVDLPVGIPLFQTGLAFYGFKGLVAKSMAPDRQAGEPWYWGWYVRDPRGATGQQKWAITPGAFAGGLGTTIGTLPDTGFTASTSVLLVLVLPGPVLLLEGKGSFLRTKPTGDEEGVFEALLALDVPAKLFQVNLAVTYSVKNLVTLHGGADVGFSWASPPPPRFWHLFLGEDQPPERRWRADLLSIFTANAYFMIEPSGLKLGAWVGFDGDFTFGPAHVWVKAEISGSGSVSVNPQHLHGKMHLGGEAGVSVFGANIVIGAYADFAVDGPTPWHVAFDLEAHLKIDLFLFKVDWSATFRFEWQEQVKTLPTPVLPLIERVAHQSLVLDDGGDLSGAAIPADSRQVIIFRRPVRDLAGIGTPGDIALLPADSAVTQVNTRVGADEVGPAKFSYRLGHVALYRRVGGSWSLAGASGFVDVKGGVLSVPGLTLEGAVGGRLTVLGGPPDPLGVTAAAAEVLTVTGPTIGDGRWAYRLRGARPSATVSVKAAAALGAGLVLLALAADPGIARDVLGGGTFTAADGTSYAVAGNSAATMTVRAGSSPLELAALLGTASVVGPEGPLLQGAWMPETGGPAGVSGGSTKLMLGARTPFAQFRNVEDPSGATFKLDPSYICGPDAVERPTCVTFDSAPLGPVGQPGIKVQNLGISGAGDAVVADHVLPGRPVVRLLELGSTEPGRSEQGSAVVTFPGPADRVSVAVSTREGGTITAKRKGSVVDQQPISRQQPGAELQGPLDTLEIEGALVEVSQICYQPDWTCLRFLEGTFPQGSTGRQSYAGVILETAGRMSVADAILTVEATKRTRLPKTNEIDWLHLRPLPFASLPATAPALPPAPRRTTPVVPQVPGLSEPTDLFLPGIGPVGATPPEATPPRRSRAMRGVPTGAASAAATARLRGDLRPLATPGLRVAPALTLDTSASGFFDRRRFGGGITIRGIAAVTIFFPRPVTRVRVDVLTAASVTIAAGPTLITTGLAAPGAPVFLDASGGWVDRVTITAVGPLQVREVCTDAGDFGWQRFQQWAWRTGMNRSLSAFKSEAPVLAPGRYRLDVVSGVVDEAQPGSAVAWSTDKTEFTVAAPPGLRVGERRGLNNLETYVEETMPAAGERPFYRSYDIGVSFRCDYVSRIYLENATPLLLGVIDGNDREIRPGTANVWGRGPELALTREETDWLKTLHAEATVRCASIDTDEVSRNELMHAGAGELLLPAQTHTGILGTEKNPRLFAFSFVTSRYASFAHHLACFGGVRHEKAKGPLDAAALGAGVRSAEQQLARARGDLKTAQDAVSSGNPKPAAFDALESARAGLGAAKEAVAAARRSAFAAAAAATGISATRPRPQTLEATVVDRAFLLECDEPLVWDRITLGARVGQAVPQTAQTFVFDEVEFGGPDAGSFVYRGQLWRTTAELWARGGGVNARLDASWTLSLELTAATRVEALVEVAAGGRAGLHADGDGASADAETTSAGSTTLTVSGTSLKGCAVTGQRLTLRSITIFAPWRQRPAAGPVLVSALTLPSSTGAADHWVEVIAESDVDLAGHRIEWRPADASDGWRVYHVVALVGRALAGGARARIIGGQATGTAVAGRETWFGGTDGALPAAGVVVRILDPSGLVLDERASMAGDADVPCDVISDGDMTRAYVIPKARRAGWWTLNMTFARDIGPGEAVLSVAGETGSESAAVGFQV